MKRQVRKRRGDDGRARRARQLRAALADIERLQTELDQLAKCADGLVDETQRLQDIKWRAVEVMTETKLLTILQCGDLAGVEDDRRDETITRAWPALAAAKDEQARLIRKKIPEAYPPRHDGQFLVNRPNVGEFIATVCYGLHPPWWCFDANATTEPMKPGDEWEPWPLGRRSTSDALCHEGEGF